MSMRIIGGPTSTFDVHIPANISLGEVHKNSGLEGAPPKIMNEQVKEWLIDDEFRSFATDMGHPELSEISQQVESLQELKNLTDETVWISGSSSSKLKQLINSKPPMSLFYCAWIPSNGGSGHATNVSVTHNNETNKWEVTFHNTGLGLDTKHMKQGEDVKQMCPCAYVFSDLDDGEVEKLLRGILHIQKAKDKQTYQQMCNDLYQGKITYEDEFGDAVEVNNFKKPKDPIHNYTFVRAQVGGNCTYASLNAMMRYLVLKQGNALHETTRTPSGKNASNAARVLDFYCRLKSMELALANIKTDGTDPQGVRFLERMLEANVCYFKKYVEKRCSAEANGGLEKIRSKLAEYRETVRQAKIERGIDTDNIPLIPEENLQNANEIKGVLPVPTSERGNRVGNRRITTNPQLQTINKSLGRISDLIAQNTPQATRQAVKRLAELCSQQMGNDEYVSHVGNAVRSLILNKNFRVDIGEALQSDKWLGLKPLEEYHTIAKFLYTLKEKDGERVYSGFYTNKEEQNSIDEQNAIYTLQAHSLQIYREVARRRNEALHDNHPNTEKFDPTEIVIDVPKIRANDHCYDRQSVDRRAELRKFSCSEREDGKLVIGRYTPSIPSTAKKIFDTLLSGEDHRDFLKSFFELDDDIEKTSRAMDKSFADLKSIKIEIVKAQKKENVLEDLNKALKALKERREKISELNPLKSQIGTLEKEVKDLESLAKEQQEKYDKAKQTQDRFRIKPCNFGFIPKDYMSFCDKLKDSLKALETLDDASKKKAIVDAIKKFIGEGCLTDDEIDGILNETVTAEEIKSLRDKDKIDDFVDAGSFIDCFREKYNEKKQEAIGAYNAENNNLNNINSKLNNARRALENARTKEEKDVQTAISQIEFKIAEVKGWPDAGKTDELTKKRHLMEANINNLAKLRTLQLAAKKEFFSSTNQTSSRTEADFDQNKMGLLRDYTMERLKTTCARRVANTQEILLQLNRELGTKGQKLRDHNPLVQEFGDISRMVENALKEIDLNGTKIAKETCTVFQNHQIELSSNYNSTFNTNTIATGGGAKIDDLMTSSDQALDDTWGQGITIDRETLDFSPEKCLKTLRKIPQQGNRYAKTMANVIGYGHTSPQSQIFDSTLSTTTHHLYSVNPYAVCGLGDLAQFVSFNKIFLSLQSGGLEPSSSLDSPMIDVYTINTGTQFAPGNFTMRTPHGAIAYCKYQSSQGVHLSDGAFGSVPDIGKNVAEEDRNRLIADQNSTSLMANLKKCNVTDEENPLDFVLSVLAAIGSRPSELVDQLKTKNTQGSIDLLIMGLLTSPKSREVISNGIKTPEDAQKLAEGCMKFLNQTWFQSSKRLFNPGQGDQKHVLEYNPDRIKAMAVCATAIAEVLATLGQGDEIDPATKAKINQTTRQALENILDSLNEKVLFQNVNNGEDAEAARREIAQLKLHLANQESKLVGGLENLSAKWCANVIASMAECGGSASGRWTFSNDLIGAELRRFCSDFALGFSKHAQTTKEPFFINHVGLAAKNIIEHSRQLPETTLDALNLNQDKRTKINYENNDTDSFIMWDAENMCFHDGDGTICDIIKGTSDIVKKRPSHKSVESLIIDQRLRSEVCKFFGIEDNKTVKSEEMENGTIKIEPTSGIHKGEVFFIKNSHPPVFKNKDGMQLLMVNLENMNCHLFKNHFCWGIERDGKVYYEFFERTGRQEVAYCAIREGEQTKFARGGLDNRQTVDPNEEIMFLDFKEISGLSHFCQDNLMLDGIFNKKNSTLELTAFQHHGESIKLQKKGDEWVLASNPNMKLISHKNFTNLLKGDRGEGLGNTSIQGAENPMGFGEKYLVFQENTTSLTAQNFMFLIPEEVQNEDEAKAFFEAGHKAKKADGTSPYGLFGRAEPSKLSLNEDTLTTRSHFLRWSMNKVGRYGEFTIPESDPKAITYSAITLIARTMREKNYTQALGLLNAIPNGLILGKSGEDDAIRKMFFDIIRDDFDDTPLSAAMHMRLLLKWLQMDTGSNLQNFLSNSFTDMTRRRGGPTHPECDFSELFKKKFVKMWREEAYYPPSFALTHLEKEALLAKLPHGIFLNYSYNMRRLRDQESWKQQQQTIVADLERKRSGSMGIGDDAQAASVVTRSMTSGNGDSVSGGERNAFAALRENFSLLNPRPNPTTAEGLLEGEDGSSKFTFLGAERMTASESPVLKEEFDRYENEIEAGREKVLGDLAFIPADADLTKTDDPEGVKKALEACNATLTKQQQLAHKELQGLYKEIFSTHIAAGIIPSENMMPILIELMLDRGKPPIDENGGSVTLNFPARKIHITISRDQYNKFLATTRSYLLTTNILQKNALISAKLEDLQSLQGLLDANPDDSSLIVQTRAAYLALNREIAAQQELYTSDEPNENFYGKVAEVVGSGITRDELMVYESLSGIRPHVKQAELLKDLFAGNTKAFQLTMGGGKTAVLVSLFCFYISRRKQMSVPVILSHPSQFESVVGNVGEYQRSRFGQDVMVLDVSRSQLKDVEQLQQILGNLQAAKKNHQVIIAKTSLLNVLQLTLQETCASSERRNMLNAQANSLKAEIKRLDNDLIKIPKSRQRTIDDQEKYDKIWEQRSALRAQQSLINTELEKYENDPKKFELLREILGFLKTETTGICDEADMNLNVMEEVNFPSGHEKPIPQTQRSAGASFFRHIATLNQSRGNDFDLFGLLKNEQAMLSDAQFKEHQDILAGHIWTQRISQDETRTWQEFMDGRGFKLDDFKKILQGETPGLDKNPFEFTTPAPTPGESESLEYTKEKETLERLAMFRGLTAELLQQTRSKSANRNYGFAIHEVSIPTEDGGAPKMERKPVFVPYVAVGQPSQNAFGNPYEKMACFFMHAMHNESPVDGSDASLVFSNATGGAQILDLFFKKIHGKIELEKSLAAEGVQQKTTLESLFETTTGMRYIEFKEALEKRDLGQPEAYNALLGGAQKHLANNPNARLLLFEYVSDEFLRFHPAMTTSGSMQIPGLVGDCVACSGTVWNHKTWPRDLDKGLKEDVGTEGQILIKQKQDFKTERAKTSAAKSAEVEDVLDTISGQPDLQNFRALIDTGGIFKTSNAETVAQKMLAWFEKKNMGRTQDNKIDVQGVLFFRPYEDRAGGAYCIMSADKTIHVLSGTTKDDIQKAGFHPDKIAVYYDEARTVGTDVKFRPTAFALQTVDPSSTSLRDLSQGSMRMRQLLEGQCVHIAIPKSYVAAKRKAEGDGKTEDSFTFEEILKWGAENQAKKLKKQLMKAHKAKIDGIFKDIILEAMQDKEISHENARQIYGAFVSFFQKEMQTDPIAMFTANKTTRDGAEEIEIYYNNQLKKFSNILESPGQGLPMAERIRARIGEARGDNGKLTEALQDAKGDLQGEKFETNENIYDADVDQEREQEQEKQTEVNQEREQDVDQERDIDLNYRGNAANRNVRREGNIDVSIDPVSTSFAHFKSFESVSAREDLQVLQTNRTFTRGPAIQNYGELLPNNFHVSRNFREVVEGETHPLSPFRKEPTYVVLHVTPDGKHEFCVVSNREAKNLEQNLKDKNIFLYDIHGTLLAGDSTTAKNFNDQKEDALNWIHFWHGDVEALQSASGTWIDSNLKKRDPENPTERSNHEVCCFRWLLSRSSHGNAAKFDNTAKEVHSIFQSAGVVSELQTEAENLFAELGVPLPTPPAPKPVPVVNPKPPVPAPTPISVAGPVSVSKVPSVAEAKQTIEIGIDKLIKAITAVYLGVNGMTNPLQNQLRTLFEKEITIENGNLPANIQEAVDFANELSKTSDDELKKLIEDHAMKEASNWTQRKQSIFAALHEKFNVPRHFWPKNIDLDSPPAPTPVPKPVPVVNLLPTPPAPKPAPKPVPVVNPKPPVPAPAPKPAPKPVPVVNPKPPVPAPAPISVAGPVSVPKVGVAEAKQIIETEINKLAEIIKGVYTPPGIAASTQLTKQLQELLEKEITIENGNLPANIQEVVDFANKLSSTSDDELKKLIEDHAMKESISWTQRKQSIFAALHEKFNVPRHFWPTNIDLDSPPAPKPVPVVNPKPSVSNQAQMNEFEAIINEIPQRRNAPWYSRFFAFFRSLVHGTTTDVELAKIQVEFKDSPRKGEQLVTTIGKRCFRDIQNKRGFLQDAFAYLRVLSDTNPEEARRNTEFLLYFCKDYLSSSKEDFEVHNLKTIISSSFNSGDSYLNDPRLKEIFMNM